MNKYLESDMNSYLHRVFGIYASRHEAEQVFERLLQDGFKREQLELIDEPGSNAETAPDSDEVRNEVLVDGAIGTAAGAGIGALGEVAIAAANVSLFIASPVLGTLMLMGWGAVVGGMIGAAVGAGTEDTRHFSDLVRDAIKHGHAVLIAHATTEEQTTTAQSVIGNSLKDPSQSGRID
jgi:hypothetical protein